MSEYHKIQTLYLRDPATNHKTLLEGQWARPEFDYLQHAEWIFTEKVDGTNIRLCWDAQTRTLAVRGKTDAAQIPPHLLAVLHAIEPSFQAADLPTCVVYGEGFGPKIQKGGGLYRNDPGFAAFDVRVGDWWLGRADVEDVAGKLGVEVAPIVGVGTLHDMVDMVRGGFMSEWSASGDFVAAEGLVARPAVELANRRGERVITKLKARDFR